MFEHCLSSIAFVPVQVCKLTRRVQPNLTSDALRSKVLLEYRSEIGQTGFTQDISIVHPDNRVLDSVWIDRNEGWELLSNERVYPKLCVVHSHIACTHRKVGFRQNLRGGTFLLCGTPTIIVLCLVAMGLMCRSGAKRCHILLILK